jgi:hypothetical protein
MQLEPIDAAPRDGSFVILHSEETGRYEIARWSRSEGRWEQEQGTPIRIVPTHWTYFPTGHDSVAEDGGKARSEFAHPPESGQRAASGTLVALSSAFLSAMLTVGALWLLAVNNLGLQP